MLNYHNIESKCYNKNTLNIEIGILNVLFVEW